MRWKIVVIAAVLAVVVAGGVVALRLTLSPDDVLDRGDGYQIQQVLKEHDAELRAIPGVTMLGTYVPADGPALIVVYVKQVTAELEAAAPDKIDGFTVEIKEESTPPPSPPVLAGVIKAVTPATPEQAADGLAGTVTIEGQLYVEGVGSSTSASSCRMLVRIPDDIQIWRPMGEAKELIEFADIRAGDQCQATLEAVPATQDGDPTADDLEVYGRI
jgi:hypothetical protein